MGAKRQRVDVELVRRGLAESRERAKALIMAGVVYANGTKVQKPSFVVSDETKLEVREDPLPYVSRGGLKLEGALKAFSLSVEGLVCLDVGASTGGFTHCLLVHGAKKVYALDVGKGQLHWKLRNDPRVVVMEGINARYLTEDDLPEKVDLATVDVSFISLKKVLGPVSSVVKGGGKVLCLVKPQFELGRRDVGRGGVVREPSKHRKAVEEVWRFGEDELGFKAMGVCESPVPGASGNREYFVLFEIPK